MLTAIRNKEDNGELYIEARCIEEDYTAINFCRKHGKIEGEISRFDGK